MQDTSHKKERGCALHDVSSRSKEEEIPVVNKQVKKYNGSTVLPQHERITASGFRGTSGDDLLYLPRTNTVSDLPVQMALSSLT